MSPHGTGIKKRIDMINQLKLHFWFNRILQKAEYIQKCCIHLVVCLAYHECITYAFWGEKRGIPWMDGLLEDMTSAATVLEQCGPIQAATSLWEVILHVHAYMWPHILQYGLFISPCRWKRYYFPRILQPVPGHHGSKRMFATGGEEERRGRHTSGGEDQGACARIHWGL